MSQAILIDTHRGAFAARRVRGQQSDLNGSSGRRVRCFAASKKPGGITGMGALEANAEMNAGVHKSSRTSWTTVRDIEPEGRR